MQDVYVIQSQITLESGSACTINYYLEEKLLEENVRIYGIRILKEGTKEEIETTGPITTSKEEGIRICDTLSRNDVTPMCLLETVDNLIAETCMI